MSAEAAALANRLRELTVQFAAEVPQAVSELLDLVAQAARSDGAPRRERLVQIELLAHRLNGRAAMYEWSRLSRRAAAVEAAAAAMLAGKGSWNARLPALCEALTRAIPTRTGSPV